jgi:hypothetical protein
MCQQLTELVDDRQLRHVGRGSQHEKFQRERESFATESCTKTDETRFELRQCPPRPRLLAVVFPTGRAQTYMDCTVLE